MRMRAQRLTGAPFAGAAEAVRHFGAVQAQDYPAAKWALGMRVEGATDASIDRAYDSGAIVRTHVMRPTWHFVAPEDLRWLLELTGPKLTRGLAGRYSRLGLDAPTIARARRVFETALEGGVHLTRAELSGRLARAGIAPDGQRLPHLLHAGELAGLLTSGSRKGREHTFALLEDRVPTRRALDRDEAIAKLTLRYFVSHGPAQPLDMVWWSGLTHVEVRRGIEAAGKALAHADIDGVTYWFDARLESPRAGRPVAHLLPNFDEYTVGYADRAAILHPVHPFRPELFSFGSVLANVVTIGGQVYAAWRRQSQGSSFVVEVRALAPLTAGERRLVENAAARYARFLDRRVVLVWP